MSLRNFQTVSERRKFIESELKIDLREIGEILYEIDDKVHCENLIGGTSLPLGVAGPIQVQNQKSKVKSYYIPLATTEGALVASVNRGCKAINLSGGAIVAVESVGVTRGPVFETSGIVESHKFKKWLENNFNLLKKEAEKTSNHLKLIKFGVRMTGRYVYVRFYFDTDQAMGMNMATIATESITKLIEEKTKVKSLAVSGNFCVDKKPSWLNFISGRGKRIWAEVILENKTIKEVLKTTPENLYQVWLTKCLIGSAMSGSIGFNSHFANIVAAFFAATGQDLAHITEASMGMTTMKIVNNTDLYISIYLPDVMMGIVGGGTTLEVKKEAIKITGVKNSDDLAKILAAAVLAGEISLLCSLSAGSLACAHKKLGR